MPQELVLVYEVETGKPAYMHSIDAAEAVNLGDYAFAPPSGKEPSDQDKLAAMSRMRGMAVNAHPELMSKEERDEVRKQANEAAAQAATPVVMVPAGSMADAEEGHRSVAHTARRQAATEEKK